MNSELPVIKVTNKALTDKTVNDLNKLSAMLFKKKSNKSIKKRKTLKLKSIAKSQDKKTAH